VDDDGRVNATPVRTGITDDQYTEIRGPGIREGMSVIAAVTSAASSSSVSNPFEGQQSQGFRGPPPVM
jgi:hypothetical protein